MEKVNTMARLKVATVWLGGCSGCHMSFLDLDEFLIELAGKVDLVFSPVIDVKEYPEDVDICLVEGAVCNQDNLEIIRKVRSRTRVLVSFGDCAVTANVPAIRNQLGLGNGESVLQRAYVEGAQTNPGVPKEPGIVPALLERVMPVHEAVAVDYFLPGCPPPADRIKALLTQVLEGKEPHLEGAQIKFGWTNNEIRNPKSEIRNKSEIRSPKDRPARLLLG
jgi:NAD-reducing hydrogenase small subunit